MAIAYNENKNYDSAIQIITTAKSKFPSNSQVAEVYNSIVAQNHDRTLAQALEFFNAKEYQKALETYMQINPPTFDSLVGMGACFNVLDNKTNAILYYKKALDKKQSSEIAYYIAVLYSEQQDFANAKPYLNKALAIDSSNQDAKDLLVYIKGQEGSELLDKGIRFYDENNYTEALNLFNKVIQGDSKNAYAYYYRASVYDAQKKYLQAIADYQKAISFSSDFDIANYLIAIDYDMLGQYKNALSYYKKYIASTEGENEYKTYSQKRIKELKIYE